MGENGANTEDCRFLESILDTSPDLIYVYDLQNKRNVYSNDGVMKCLGYTREQIKDFGPDLIQKLMDPGDFRVYLRDTIRKYASLEDDDVLEHEYRMRDANGDWRMLQSRERVFRRTLEGDPVQIFAIVRDVTEERAALDALRRSEQRYRRFFEEAPVPLWEEDFTEALEYARGLQAGVADLECHLAENPDEVGNIAGKVQVLDINEATLQLHDAETKQDLLRSLRCLMAPESLSVFRREILALLAGERRFREDARVRTLKGEMVDIHVELIREEDITGRDLVRVATPNITSHEQAKKRLTEVLAELERSNEELEQFAYVASHDLREPLRMISTYTQLLEERYGDRLDDQGKEFISYASDGARHLQQLISDLLLFSRAGRVDRALIPVDLNVPLSSAIANLSKQIEESDAIIRSDPLPWVRGDRTQLMQLFQNLISNAIKFRSERPLNVQITAEPLEDRKWQVSVSDNGIGIEEQYAERIFAVFQRLHTREEHDGTGVGLALCRRIMERHDGRIWLESTPGEGSTFHLVLNDRDEGNE